MESVFSKFTGVPSSGKWAYAGMPLFTGSLTGRRTDWQGLQDIVTKALVKFCMWGAVTPFSVKGQALNEQKATLQGRTWGSLQTTGTLVNSVTLWWRRPPHRELYWKDYSQQLKSSDYSLPFSICETVSEAPAPVCSPVKGKHWRTGARPEEGCQNNQYWRVRCTRRGW